jgi:hypothetical protein
MNEPSPRSRGGRSYFRVVAFLLGFAAILVVVCFYYLFPAMEAAQQGTPRDRKTLSAVSWLVLAVVLFVLIVLLLLSFRISRFFFPRASPPRSRTTYVDAWSESGKRMRTPPEE